MEERIKQKLIRLGIREGDTLGIAVSGGVDSMALLHCAYGLKDELGIDVACYHMEHGIRGKLSIDDMHFVQDACQKLGVECIVQSADVPKLAEQTGTSVETAARNVRYAFLDEQKADWIATAHHMGDVAETVLMNLARGSGLSGLVGIPEKRGKYIRPILHFSRDEIVQYANDNDMAFAHDATNDDTEYTRNYIRHQILPQMMRVNDAAIANMARAAMLLKEDEDALCAAAASAGCIRETQDEAIINISKLVVQHIAVQRRIVRHAIKGKFGLKDIERVHIACILDLAHKGDNAKRVDLPKNLVATVVYGKLVIGKNKPKRYNKPLVALPDQGRFDFAHWAFETERFEGEPAFGDGVEYFDGEAVKGAQLRHRQEKDYIVPLGMNGTKRLSDYLSDKKVPLNRRDELTVLARGSEVFWVVGVGVSQTSKIWEHSTVIKIRFWEK